MKLIYLTLKTKYPKIINNNKCILVKNNNQIKIKFNKLLMIKKINLKINQKNSIQCKILV